MRNRPDPKQLQGTENEATDPQPARKNPHEVGRDLNTLQKTAPEQDRRFHHHLQRFLWS